jgi:hypothetical protein
MQVEFNLKLGKDEFLLKVDVANAVEFFEKLSFYSSLPRLGPNGEDDLKITHRTTNDGYNYYSLVSEKAGMEFKFGQPKEDPKGLFPKSWSPIYKGEVGSTDQTQVNMTPRQQPKVNQDQVVRPTPAVTQSVLPTPAQVQAPVQAPPVQVTQAAQKSANDVLARFGIKTQPQQ